MVRSHVRRKILKRGTLYYEGRRLRPDNPEDDAIANDIIEDMKEKEGVHRAAKILRVPERDLTEGEPN